MKLLFTVSFKKHFAVSFKPPRMHLSATITVDTQPTLHWSPALDTHLLPRGGGTVLCPALYPGTQQPCCQQPHLATHNQGTHQCTTSWPAHRDLACRSKGLQGHDGVYVFTQCLAAGTRIQRPLQGSSSGATTSMRLSQLRLHTAKGSFTRTVKNRKISCPRRDLFYSYSGKYNCTCNSSERG